MLWAIQPLMHYGMLMSTHYYLFVKISNNFVFLLQFIKYLLIGSCADLMHSSHAFASGFQENVIGIILRDIVKALHYLHTLGYVHR